MYIIDKYIYRKLEDKFNCDSESLKSFFNLKDIGYLL